MYVFTVYWCHSILSSLNPRRFAIVIKTVPGFLIPIFSWFNLNLFIFFNRDAWIMDKHQKRKTQLMR